MSNPDKAIMTVTPELLDDVEAKAKAATPGPRTQRNKYDVFDADGGAILEVTYDGGGGWPQFISRHDSAFCVRMDPPTTLALVARIRALEQSLTNIGAMSSDVRSDDAGRMGRMARKALGAARVSARGDEGEK